MPVTQNFAYEGLDPDREDEINILQVATQAELIQLQLELYNQDHFDLDGNQR